jgi:hypothetical protein
MIFSNLPSRAVALSQTANRAMGFAQTGNRYSPRIKCGAGFFGSCSSGQEITLGTAARVLFLGLIEVTLRRRAGGDSRFLLATPVSGSYFARLASDDIKACRV